MVKKLLSLLAVAALASAASVWADTVEVFTGSQAGLCCFNVTLDQMSSTEISVTVSLTHGAQYFIHTGNGRNHPGFAMDLSGTTGNLTVQNISSPWTLSSVSFASDRTRGPRLGTFDFEVTNPGRGSNAHNAGPLVFDLVDLNGLSLADFIAVNLGFYFEADIRNAAGRTGTSGISTPGVVAAVPEPSSLVLLGSGLVAIAVFLRRRLAR